MFGHRLFPGKTNWCIRLYISRRPRESTMRTKAVRERKNRTGWVRCSSDSSVFARARRIAAVKSRQTSKVRGTNTLRFTKGGSDKLQVITWDEFERDLLECRHVPSLRCATVWRRADGCTTMML